MRACPAGWAVGPAALRMRTLIFLALLALTTSSAALNGTVTRVADGDTLWVRLDHSDSQADPGRHKSLKIRLQGIDAPERCQAWGVQAKAALEGRVLHRRVRLKSSATDDYHRSIATLDLDGEDIGAWMVGQGHAWSARFHRSAGPYAAQERAARSARRGLFAEAGAVEPRRFRKAHGPCR